MRVIGCESGTAPRSNSALARGWTFPVRVIRFALSTASTTRGLTCPNAPVVFRRMNTARDRRDLRGLPRCALIARPAFRSLIPHKPNPEFGPSLTLSLFDVYAVTSHEHNISATLASRVHLRTRL